MRNQTGAFGTVSRVSAQGASSRHHHAERCVADPGSDNHNPMLIFSVLPSNAKGAFNVVLNRAQTILRQKFGMELYELRARSKGAAAGEQTQAATQTQRRPKTRRLDAIEEDEEEGDDDEEGGQATQAAARRKLMASLRARGTRAELTRQNRVQRRIFSARPSLPRSAT